MSLNKNWDTPEEWSSKLQVQQLELLNDAYVKYKRAKGKLDFIDMIEKFISQGTSPKFDLLIIDEAQDLVPLQWRMVKEVLVPNSKEVFYAGDDDQAIYGWMGVDVKRFLEPVQIKEFLKNLFVYRLKYIKWQTYL